MVTPLLQTKFYIPTPRPDLVSRSRLIDRLNAGLRSSKLTLVSAPAGFGKTTLLSEWVAGCGQPVAWLSLEQKDNDLARFLTYVVSALQTIDGKIGQGALPTLQSPGPIETDAVLTALLNELAKPPDHFAIVLDDYHTIESRSIDQALAFLLDHLPPQFHLVIASRTDPALPLSRLRARGQLTELRQADLRFTIEEATAFLEQSMCVPVSTDNVRTLADRTEGWITGLQLAALAIQSIGQSERVADFVHSFGGSHRYVIDYLVDEVLEQQTPQIQAFLLQTAILDRLTAPLCNAVTNRQDSQAILEQLETANLFLVPLDGQRRWYRYHHLFADLLRQRLRLAYPEQIPMMHLRASEWFDRNELPSQAIHHALAAEEPERAADLAELAWPAWSGSYQSIAWLGWLETLPDELVRVRPVLCVAYAWANLNAGNLEAAEAHLQDAEQWLEPVPDTDVQRKTVSTETHPESPVPSLSRASVPSLSREKQGMVVVDQEQFRSLPASLTTARAYHAQAVGDTAGTVKYARRVLDLLPEGDSTWRGDATALLGLAQYASGDLEAAHQTFSDGLAGMKPLDIILGTFVLADIKTTLGRLHEAASTCQRALQIATDHGDPLPIGTEDVYVAVSKLHREQGNLQAAEQDLRIGKELGEKIELPDWQYRWCIAQAQLQQTLGEMDGALDLLDEAERVYVRTPLPDVCPIPAQKARIWIRQGRPAKATSWARERGLSVDDPLCYLCEFEHITLARILIARYRNDRMEQSIHEAVELLERLLHAAKERGRTGSVIEILVLQALAYQAQGDIPSSLVSLERALTLAEPQGYVCIFADEGPPMEALLREAAKRGITPGYTGRLQKALREDAVSKPTTQPLVEPLSERELKVLRLIAQGLSNREISERLYIALNTVKGHNRKIFGKLAVQRRTEAVARARELGLL